jgi:DNA-binding response OmpR family regulator
MPYLTGSELCQALKADREVRHIPVILLSACTDTAERAEKCGADDYLLKPYSITDLYERIAFLLARPSPTVFATPNSVAA